MFSNSSTPVPCVGVSIGVERVFAILSKHAQQPRSSPTQVYVTAPDGNLIERMKIATMLWDANIPTEFGYKSKPKIGKELGVCDGKEIPIAVIIGKSEVEMGVVKVKDLRNQVEFLIERERLVEKIRELIVEEEERW